MIEHSSKILYGLSRFQAMPICPKCHKLISESHYARHVERCGLTHNTKVASSALSRKRAAGY